MKNILFICIENSCRSQMAEAFAIIHGRGLVNAHSAGSMPSGIVNEKAIMAMQKIGYDLSLHQSKSIDEFSGEKFDMVVTMGCGDACPNIQSIHNIDWNIPDPKKMNLDDFINVRNMIEIKVKRLLEDIEKK